MFWYGMYLLVAAAAAIAIFLAACWFREEHVAAPDRSGMTSVLAGMLWPVLLVGLSELALVWLALRGARYVPLEAVRSS